MRIDEQLYSPDELLDRAVLDSQGTELGVVIGLVKIKRSYRGVVIKTRFNVRRRYGLGETVNVPVGFLARTRARLDEIVLSRTFDKMMGLPSYLKLNSDLTEEE